MSVLDRKPVSVTPLPSSTSKSDSEGTLAALCRGVIVSNLERFPTEAFGILDEHEWETMIQLRHERTKPQKGKGGLDGTGRMNPAIGDKFMIELEENIPHLAHSSLVDELVWKDIVEYRFRVGGLSRPRGLMYPWPILEANAEEYASTLVSLAKKDPIEEEARKLAWKTIKAICEIPMDVTLLKSSGIGKAVKKFLKAFDSNESLRVFDEPISNHDLRETARTKLEATLQAWMAMAAKCGVKMESSSVKDSPDEASCAKDLAKARKSNSWRDLFAILRDYDEKRKCNQGARMRERRQILDSVRPKIVKVRHASSRQNDIISRQQTSTSASSPAKQKIQQLRMEAAVTSTRRRPPGKTQAVKPAPTRNIGGNGFGAAVAFATGQRGPSNKRKDSCTSTRMVQLAGNKRMKIPESKKAKANMKRLAKKGGFSFR